MVASGSHSNNPYLQELSYGLQGLSARIGAARPCSCREFRVSVSDTPRELGSSSRARADALRDPWCIRSGSLTGFSGGCHCVRRRSNFEILSNKNSLLDVVTTAVPSADAASDASRHL